MSSNIKNINYDDFKNICRLCMFDCDVKFYLDHVVSYIYHKLTDLRFDTNDDLPKQICQKCFDKMCEIHEFMFQCVRTHDALMECLKQKQLNEAEEVQNKEQDVTVNANRNKNGGELVMSLQKRVKVEERNNHNIEIDQTTELDEGIIPEAREIKEEVIENIDLPKTSYNLTEEITIEEHKIEYVKDEHVFDEASEIEQNIKSDDLFAPNMSNINSGSNKDPDYNNTSSDAHMNKHSGERPFKCDHCAKSFLKAYVLKVHMRTHTGERPFECDQCSKSFIQLYHMRIHMRTHTGERPFKCDQCSKSFSRICHMKTHLRTHSNERPFKCDQCPKSFSRSSSLKTHMRTHTEERPYKCDQCSKSCNDLSNMKKHMRTHTGERPYKCDQCSKSFGQLSRMKIHMRTHTGERPYKCTQCSKKFNYSDSLKKHMRKHTDNTCDQ